MTLAWFYWDPPLNIFTVPIIDRPVTWYGFLFVLGLSISYYFIYLSLKKKFTLSKQESLSLTDRLTWFVVGGTLIGARLGHVFFYDWPRYARNPFDILKIWEGGLASHGAAIGIFISIFLFLWTSRKQFPQLNFVNLVDLLSIPAALTCAMIRVGNFVNQEILGPPTDLPWGVIFGHPVDGSAPIPRHPVQLYEALAYFCIFLFLLVLVRVKGDKLRQGVLGGLFFVLMCSARFLLEFFKSPFQSQMIDESYIQMGQLLSLPLILFGLILIFFGSKLKCSFCHSKLTKS